jgi:acetylornithine deacetylase
MTEAELAFLSRIESCRDRLIELTRALVRINTVNPYSGDPSFGSEAAGQEFVRAELDPLGPNIVLFDCPDDIYERSGAIGPRSRNFRGRPNLVAEFEFGEGPRVVLNAHIDTVDTVGMTIPPFEPEVRDGKIWGRGSSDDKSGHAIAIVVLEALSEVAGDLGGSIVFESVVDEECNGSGAGTLACMDAGYCGDEAIMLDGEALEIIYGCSGVLTASVRVPGKAGHAAMAGTVNAIDKAIFVKGAIDALKAEREAANPGNRLNVGVFRAGTLPAVVPGLAEMQLNMTFSFHEAATLAEETGDWSGAPIREAFEERIAARAHEDDWLREHPPTVEWIKALPPYRVPPEHPLVSGLAAALRDALDREPVLLSLDAWGDAAWTDRVGGMPTVMFAPAMPGKAHSADECVEIEDIVGCAKVLGLYLYRRLRQSMPS